MKLRKQMAAMMVTAGIAAVMMTACGSKSEQATTAAPAETTTAAAETTAAQTTAAETTAAETTAAETTAEETTAEETTTEEAAAEFKTETYKHPLGFSFTYYTGYFDLDESENGVRLLYTKDDYNNYVSISYTEEYSPEELKNGLVLQAPTEDILEDKTTFGSTGEMADVVMYNLDEDTVLQFDVLPYQNGSLLIESGSHIYDEDDTLVSDLIAEIYNSIEL
jgi:hypothetical protein